MKIQLNTSKFCIGTGAKKSYEALLKHYFQFKGSQNDRLELENKIEGLKYFLENIDIPKIRSQFLELDQGGNTDVILEIDTDFPKFTVCFHNKTINLPLLKIN